MTIRWGCRCSPQNKLAEETAGLRQSNALHSPCPCIVMCCAEEVGWMLTIASVCVVGSAKQAAPLQRTYTPHSLSWNAPDSSNRQCYLMLPTIPHHKGDRTLQMQPCQMDPTGCMCVGWGECGAGMRRAGLPTNSSGFNSDSQTQPTSTEPTTSAICTTACTCYLEGKNLPHKARKHSLASLLWHRRAPKRQADSNTAAIQAGKYPTTRTGV